MNYLHLSLLMLVSIVTWHSAPAMMPLNSHRAENRAAEIGQIILNAAKDNNFGLLQDTLESSPVTINLDELKDSNMRSNPLLWAVRHGNLALVKYLIEGLLESMSLETTDVNGNNALHIAAKFGHLPVVEYLMNLGINNISNINHRGKTALDVALDNRHEAIVACLLGQTSPTQPSRPSTLAPVAKPAAAARPANSVEQEATCPICLNKAKELGPRAIAKTKCCKQFLCAPCFSDLKARDPRAKCPMCRQDLAIEPAVIQQ